MNPISVTLTSSSTVSHVPLAALGYALRRAAVLEPLIDLDLPQKVLEHTPTEKLVSGLVLMLAGGRALYQSNWLRRPNRRLARAWGQAEFAEQSTVSDTFDTLDEASLQDLQAAFAQITRNWSQTCHHDFRRADLTLDGDLTGLPASRKAAAKVISLVKKPLWATNRARHSSTVGRIARVAVVSRRTKRPKLPATVGGYGGTTFELARHTSTATPLAIRCRLWHRQCHQLVVAPPLSHFSQRL